MIDLAPQHPQNRPPGAAGRSPLIGARLRDQRKRLRLTQSGLAAQVGISPSYLNLIEGNRRSIGGALLKRLADALGLDVAELDGARERRLAGALDDVAGDPLLSDLRLAASATREIAARFPGWAEALVRLHRSCLDRGAAVAALSDRLNQDPFLGTAVHGMLTRVASIRSASEILDAVADLSDDERSRFVSIIAADSARLSGLAQALAAYFDRAHTETRSITPVEEVDDFLLERDNHFPALEQAAADFRAAAGITGDCRESTLVEYLQRTHSVTLASGSAATIAGSAPRMAVFDPVSRVLTLADEAPRSTRRFELARLATGLFHQGRAVSSEIESAENLSSEAARRRAQGALGAYLAAAALLPYGPFLEAAIRLRYDVEALSERFEASFEQVAHRLTTLRRPGAGGVPFGFMRIDPAGHVSKRLPLPRFVMPRHGTACPLWAVYQAFQAPGTVVRQFADFPAGERFLIVARTVEKPRPAFTMPRRLMSVALVCDALHADRTTYADGLDPASQAGATPVGASCRLCPRSTCPYREEDPIIDA